ncbi:MAG: hypothetical protein COX62_07405 [Deltaproteobacteria bacterium CG_4_10_14_0_2_um_filter_43_8]|nr:MAG: hypothetical protein COV43_06150 [Deltaproteobacteria bacterium CG11_big_fil_rev_8_21_14_0_20_42_23]PJA19038.1 MAG: hypothetical protein COX62_07405 [Deltaproteobacteria bacterium CG_4_10_14_0_2_um_filter_43_8]PJC65174.1 MAG: hypothetical protein CO021_00545 [Deltaproteobacteria bacterium CG_4_9_14_0_2_um_filter_42_21]
MEYRRPHPHEFEQIIALQKQNLFVHLNDSERKDGMLSTEFSLEQFQQMNKECVVVVAVEASKVWGYLCASTAAFNLSKPIPAAMIRHCEKIVYRDKPLSSYSFFIASPTCVDVAYRGKNLFLEMCKALISRIPQHYELAVGFVSSKNQRSLAACKKIGMEMVDQFCIDKQTLFIQIAARCCRKMLTTITLLFDIYHHQKKTRMFS